jgi:hypothetical protein
MTFVFSGQKLPMNRLVSSEPVLHFPSESRESENFVRLLLEHAHDSVHIVDENGVSVFDTASRTGMQERSRGEP